MICGFEMGLGTSGSIKNKWEHRAKAQRKEYFTNVVLKGMAIPLQMKQSLLPYLKCFKTRCLSSHSFSPLWYNSMNMIFCSSLNKA